MIDIGRILRRSWHILWNYRTLWIFGILLALTAGGGSGGSSGSGYHFNGNNGSNGNNTNYPNIQISPLLSETNDWFNHNITPFFTHPEEHIATFIWIGIGIFLFILIMVAITSILRYVSENAVIRMVDEYEHNGEKVNFKQGWRLGWNRRAFRMWVIDLVISIPIIVFILLLGALGLLVFFSWVNGANFLAISGTVAAIGCAFLFIFTFIILMVFLGLLRQFFIRRASLEEASIGDSFRDGWNLFKSNWKSAALMWLVMLGIGIGYGIAGIVLFFLLIPLYLILLVPAVLVAAIPGAIAFGIASIFTTTLVAGIVAAVVAVVPFFLVLFAPMVLMGGWYHIYTSSVWTLTYREMKALQTIHPEPLPAENE
jgi:hypothetical protein